MGDGQLQMWSTGESYDIAKITANLTGSYLVTDLDVRWKEIELDREDSNSWNKEWAPFAKAFQGLELTFLDNLQMRHALKLRQEDRLESLRVFLRRVWKSACSADQFSEINAQLLGDELTEEVIKAEEEWNDIKRDLVKWVGAEVAGGIAIAPNMLSSGHGVLLPAVFAAAAGTTLAAFHNKKKGFPDKFPAAFFMNLRK